MTLLAPRQPVGVTRLPIAARASWERERAGRMDRVLIVAVLLLCTAGSVLVYSASRPHLQAAGADPESLMVRHVISIGLGLAAAERDLSLIHI